MTNYTSIESLESVVCVVFEKIIYHFSDFFFYKQLGTDKPSIRPRVVQSLKLNLSGIEYRAKTEIAAQCYSQEINQQNRVRLCRYSDWLARYLRF